MEKINIEELKTYTFIKRLLSILDDRWGEIYLVGGTVRDYYLNRSSCDLDFVVPWNEMALARKFANKIHGKFFVLGEKEKVARVILKEGEDIWKFDFTSFRGNDIYEDLEKRDFTVNALAFSLTNSVLIDLFNGIDDIKKKVLRPISSGIFLDDPVRIMRAFRLSYSLFFTIMPKLYSLIERYREHLKVVSGERIRDELLEILKVRDFPQAIFELYEKKILNIIFPNILYDYELFLRFKRVLENDLGNVFSNYKDNLLKYIDEFTSFMRRRREMMKIALLFLFLPDSLYKEYLEKIKLTRKEIRMISAIISQTKEFVKEKTISLERLFLLPEYVQDELPGIAMILYVLDEFVSSYKILEIFYKKLLPGRGLPLLVDGNILQEKWGLSRGPGIKKILDSVRIAQIRGEISTEEDAYRFIDEFIENHI